MPVVSVGVGPDRLARSPARRAAGYRDVRSNLLIGTHRRNHNGIQVKGPEAEEEILRRRRRNGEEPKSEFEGEVPCDRFELADKKAGGRKRAYDEQPTFSS